MRRALLIPVAGILLAGCGGGEKANPAPSDADRADAQSVELTVEQIDEADLLPGDDFVTTTLKSECLKPGVFTEAECDCGVGAVASEMTPAEFVLVSLVPGPERKQVVKGIGNAYVACKKNGVPPASLGLDGIGEGSEEVTADGLRQLGLFDGQDVNSVLEKSCEGENEGSAQDSCGCFSDTVLDDFDPYEAMILGLKYEDQLTSDYMEDVLAYCA